MALSTTMMARDFDAMVADLPATIVWTPSGGAEQTITDCTRDEIERTEENQLAGINDDQTTMVIAKVSSFTNSVTPPVGDPLTLDDESFRVSANIPSQDGVTVRLELRRQ